MSFAIKKGNRIERGALFELGPGLMLDQNEDGLPLLRAVNDWEGTDALGTMQGGTGLQGVGPANTLMVSTGSALLYAKIADANVSDTAAIAWSKVSKSGAAAADVGAAEAGHGHALTDASITGVLPLAKGGTGLSAAGTEGTFLRTGADGAVAWAAITAADVGAALPGHTHLAAEITDLATAATGITRVGTISEGVWDGTAVAWSKVSKSGATAADVGAAAAGHGHALTDASITGVLPVSRGGTGLAASGAEGTFLRSSADGSLAWAALSAADMGGALDDHTHVAADITDLATAATGITRVGTISQGVWDGTAVAWSKVSKSGATAADVGAAAASHGHALTDAAVTGVLPVAKGGTGLSAAGTEGTFLRSGAAGAVAWAAVTAADVGAAAASHTHTVSAITDLATAATGITRVGTISQGVWDGTAVAWSKVSKSGATAADVGAAASGHGHALTDAAITGVLPVAKGGTGLSAAGTEGTFLRSGAAGAVAWAAVTAADVGAAAASHTHTVSAITDLATAATGITQVGTLSAGTWQGTAVAPAYGGTGLSAVGAAGTVLTSNGTALSYAQVADANVSSTAAIAWGKISKSGATAADVGAAPSGHGHVLTDAGITGTLPISKGGTGITTAGAAGQVLTTSGTVASWASITNSHVATSAAIAWTKINKSGATAADVGAAAASHGHALTDALITGVLPVAKGGTGLSAAGTEGTFLRSGAAGAVAWAAVTAADVGAAAASHTHTVSAITDLATAATGITRLGTVSEGVWEGTPVAWSKVNRTGAVLSDLGGTLSHAALPAGTGTWNVGTGNTLTVGGGLTVQGPIQADEWPFITAEGELYGVYLHAEEVIGVIPPDRGGTGQSIWAAGDLLYATQPYGTARLAIGTAGTVLVSTGTAPSWAAITNTHISSTAAIAWSKISKTGATAADVGAAASGHTHALTDAAITGTLPISKGGTGITTAGAASQVLTTNGTAASWGAIANAHVSATAAIAWTKISKSGATAADVGAAAASHGHALTDAAITGVLAVAKGGTGLSAAGAEGTFLRSGAAGAVAWAAITAADVGAAAASHTHTVSSITDLATAATGITQVGTISAGAWQGTAVAPAYGGTGLAAVGAAGTVLTSNGTALSYAQVADANVSTTAAIAWTKISKTGATAADVGAAASGHTHALTDAAITGTLPISKGGTGITTAGAASQVLTTNGTAASWGAIANAHVSTTAAIAWTKISKSGATAADVGAAASGHGHALTDATITGTLPLAKGGTGLGTVGAAGTVPISNGTALAYGQIADANVSATAAIAWSKIDKTGATAADIGAAGDGHHHTTSEIDDLATASTGITSVGTILQGTWAADPIAVEYGGTGVNASSASNGQLLIGNGSGFSLANVIAGSGVNITTGPGTLIIGASQAAPSSVGSQMDVEYFADMNSDGTGTHIFHVGSSEKLIIGSTVRFLANAVPDNDNHVSLGATGKRWTAVHAVQGTIQTSTRQSKELLGTISGAAALEMVRGVPVHRFRYHDDTEGMTHVGVVLDELPEALRTTPTGLNYASIASVALAGVQGLDTEVLALRRRVAELEGRLAAR